MGSRRSTGGSRCRRRAADEAGRYLDFAYVAAEDLFRDQDGTAFADILVDGHRETWPVRSSTFRHWLLRRYYREEGRRPRGEFPGRRDGHSRSPGDVLSHERQVHVRAAAVGDDRVFVDMGDPEWRAIEITPEGWRIVPATAGGAFPQESEHQAPAGCRCREGR